MGEEEGEGFWSLSWGSGEVEGGRFWSLSWGRLRGRGLGH